MIKLRHFVKNIRPYKPGKPIEEIIRELGITGDVIKLASNENPLGPSPQAIHAVEETLKFVNLYPDDNCFYLKKKMSSKFKIDSNRIIVGSGSVELIELIFKAYVNPGDEVIMSEPSFIMYKIACQIFGGERIAISLKDFAHDTDAMLSAMTDKTKIVIVDNPINPTGTIIKKDSFDRFVKKIPSHVIVVVDEAYKEYIDLPAYPNGMDYLAQHQNIIVLRTFSKIYGLAGLRIGYGFSSDEIIGALMKVRLPFNVNRVAQIAATAALDDNAFVARSVKNNEEGKEFLYKELEALGIDYVPTCGNFILVNFDRDATEVFQAIQKKGMITRTVLEYGLPHSLRITIGAPSHNQRLIEILKEIT